MDALAHVAREQVESVPGVTDQDLDDAVSQLRAPLDDEGRGAASQRVRDEPMPVGLASTQGEEHAPLHDFAGVGVVGRERISDLGASDLATAGRLEQLEERQLHMCKCETGGVIDTFLNSCKWSGSPNSLRAYPNRCAALHHSLQPSLSTCEIEDFTGFLVRGYAPVEDDRLGDLLPHRRGGQVAVVQSPVRAAAGVMRLAHDDDHRELRVLGGKETDV